MQTRVLIAYSILAVIAVIAVPTIAIRWQQRKRTKLRRRGIKTYEHRKTYDNGTRA